MLDFRAILRDPVDLRGLPSVADGSARWLPPSDLPNAERDGKEGILFLDELNAAPASVQAACFGLVLDRKVGEYKLPDGWRIVAAGNRQSDRAAAQRMPTALANRFAHIDVNADHEDFVEWAEANGIDHGVIDFIKFRPGLLHNMEGADQRAFPTPRSWSMVSRLSKLPMERQLTAVEGVVGKGAAAEYMGFVRLRNQLPSLKEILANPETTRVPEEPGAKYAVSSGIARVVDKDTLGAGVIYMRRLPKEFSVMMMTDAVRRDKSLRETKTYIDWVAENQDVIF